MKYIVGQAETNSESDSQLYTEVVELVSELKSELLSYVEAEQYQLDTWVRQLDNLIAKMWDASLEVTVGAFGQFTLRQTLLGLRQELVRQRMGLRFIQPILPALIVPSSSSTRGSKESSTPQNTEMQEGSASSVKPSSTYHIGFHFGRDPKEKIGK